MGRCGWVRYLTIAAGLGALVSIALTGCASAEEKEAFLHFAAVSPAAPGASHASDGLQITETSQLRDYLAYAARHNPGLEAAFNRWHAALQQVPQARALAEPTVSYSYFVSLMSSDDPRNILSLQQAFPWFGKLELQSQAALQGTAAAAQQYEAARLKLFNTVKNAYYEYYYLSRAIAITGQNRDLLRYMEESARNRYQVGAAQEPEVIQAQTELSKLDSELQSLADLRSPLSARLSAALNRPLDETLPWPQSAPAEHLAWSDAEVLAALAENNPELRGAVHEIAQEQTAMALAKKNYFPDLMMGLDYMPRTSSEMNDGLGLSVGFTIPLWHEKYKAIERQARARHQAALKSREERQNALGADLKMALYGLRDASRRAGLYGQVLIARARQSLQSTESGYRTGKSSLVEVLDTQRELLAFQLAYERAQADYNQKLAEVEMLAGCDLPRRAEAAGLSGPAPAAPPVVDPAEPAAQDVPPAPTASP